MKEEIWKDIPGYEGLYQASNLGRIRSLLNHHGRGEFLVLSQRLNTNNYFFVLLYKNGIRKFVGVHRLVCLAFHRNPNNLPCVNHKDENPHNNHADNLEWCTQKYNCNYGSRNERLSESLHKKSVLQVSRNGARIRVYKSISDASSAVGVTPGSIWGCCNGRNYEAKGYLWFYTDDPDIEQKVGEYVSHYMRNSIIQCSLDGSEIATYINAVSASENTGIDQSCILKCAKGERKTAGGYIWKYAGNENRRN